MKLPSLVRLPGDESLNADGRLFVACARPVQNMSEVCSLYTLRKKNLSVQTKLFKAPSDTISCVCFCIG